MVRRPLKAAKPAAEPPPGTPRTVAEALGQIAWLLTQSPMHRELKLKTLDIFLPPIMHTQFRVFTFGALPGSDDVGDGPAGAELAQAKAELERTPLGFAVWAEASAAAEAKIERGEPLAEADWQSGDRLWLVELISPYATAENRLTEAMLFDLMEGPFAGREFRLHSTSPTTGQRQQVTVRDHLSPGWSPTGRSGVSA